MVNWVREKWNRVRVTNDNSKTPLKSHLLFFVRNPALIRVV